MGTLLPSFNNNNSPPLPSPYHLLDTWIAASLLPHLHTRLQLYLGVLLEASAKMLSDQLLGRDALTSNPNLFNYPRMSDINITPHGSCSLLDWTQAWPCASICHLPLHHCCNLLCSLYSILYHGLQPRIRCHPGRVRTQRSSGRRALSRNFLRAIH